MTSSSVDEGVVADPHEARHHLARHLHARERLLAGDRVAQPDRDRQREVRDVGERAARADGERGQHREDLLGEEAVDALQLARPSSRCSPPPGCPPRRAPDAARAPTGGCGGAPSSRTLVGDQLDRLGRREAVVAARVDAGVDLVVQAGDAHHVELVEVGGVDREELDPLQQRDALVLGQLEHALVELQPGQLAVEVEVGRVEVDRRRRPLALGSVCVSVSTGCSMPLSSSLVIWLLRHADAADGSPDAERPLTDKGRAQSRAAGRGAEGARRRARRLPHQSEGTRPRHRRAGLRGSSAASEPQLERAPRRRALRRLRPRRRPRRRGAAGRPRPGLLDGGAHAHRRPGADEEGRPGRHRTRAS